MDTTRRRSSQKRDTPRNVVFQFIGDGVGDFRKLEGKS
jgi:hypothetical protein